MPLFKNKPAIIAALFCMFFLLNTTTAHALLGLFEKKEISKEEKQETVEKITDIQEKLKLLQDKLRALERRKAVKRAAEESARAGDKLTAAPDNINWLPVDNTVSNPGDFGLYTYLLFNGDMADTAAVGSLEDLILTIETLQSNDIPAGLANRFLVPVEKPSSTIDLGRQPYDFKLNRAYLDRLAIKPGLAQGPILVSTVAPIDPYGLGEPPEFMAVSLGRQAPQKALELAKYWHDHEKDAIPPTGHPVADIFWGLIDGVGTTKVTRYGQKLFVELSD